MTLPLSVNMLMMAYCGIKRGAFGYNKIHKTLNPLQVHSATCSPPNRYRHYHKLLVAPMAPLPWAWTRQQP
jgi:hypothetical protein